VGVLESFSSKQGRRGEGGRLGRRGANDDGGWGPARTLAGRPRAGERVPRWISARVPRGCDDGLLGRAADQQGVRTLRGRRRTLARPRA
jgi:hypothetical protein